MTGAVIASEADASRNILNTGTLTYSDITNQSSYNASSSGFSGGGTFGDGGNNYATHGAASGTNAGSGSPAISQHESGGEFATTRSAIGAGTINVADHAHQTQDIASLNRDTTNTNGTVSTLPDVNQILVNQSDMMNAAAAAGETVSRRIGDFAQDRWQQAKDAGDQAGMDAWREGGPARAAMHVAGAAMVAGLGGGSAIGGAAGAAIASIAANNLNRLSDGIAGVAGDSDAARALGNIVSNAIATGAGAVVGGDSGAFSAGHVDRYNRQLHPDEKKRIADKANGDKAEEDRLTKAACYAVKCWAEYPQGSDAYNANYVSQLEASQLGRELAWVNNQKEAGLFNYTPGQKVTDMVKSDPLGVGKDAAKIVLGGVTTKTGAALCATSGAGCGAGLTMVAFGLSDVAEGLDGLYNRYNGTYTESFNPLRWGFNEALPAGWGNIAYDSLNLTAAVLALKAPVPLKVGTADGLGRSGSMFDVTVPKINNNWLIPFTGGAAAPYGVNQGILIYGVGTKGAAVINDVRQAGTSK